MSSSDKETSKHSTTLQSGSKPSVAPDDGNKGTQLRRGRGLAVIKIIDGPGAGTSHPVYSGDNAIGRGDQNRISLAFGDDAIHREGHAWISAQDGKFSIEHGGKGNPVYVNGDKITDSRSLKPGDQIKMGKTTLRLDPA
jgi:hypothetical protein